MNDVKVAFKGKTIEKTIKRKMEIWIKSMKFFETDEENKALLVKCSRSHMMLRNSI